MPKAFTPKVVTANDLILGDVVYLSPQDTWVRALSQAALYEQEETANKRLAFAAAQTETVVGVYLADAEASPDGPVPTHFRETFRATGPSNYQHGKQALP